MFKPVEFEQAGWESREVAAVHQAYGPKVHQAAKLCRQGLEAIAATQIEALEIEAAKIADRNRQCC